MLHLEDGQLLLRAPQSQSADANGEAWAVLRQWYDVLRPFVHRTRADGADV